MAATTRDAGMLRELWAALGNDPQLIAECLARQTLVERLIHDWYAFDERFHGRLKKQAIRDVESLGRIKNMKGMKGVYHEVEWRKEKNPENKAKDNGRIGFLKLSDDEWNEAVGRLAGIFGEKKNTIPLRRLSTLQEDGERFYVMGVLSKGTDRMKVAVAEWMKVGFDTWWSRVSERFTPEVEAAEFTYRLPEIASEGYQPYAPDTWSATFVMPSPRVGHTAVWTGTEMIVWGGVIVNYNTYTNTGGRYDPLTDTWTSTSTTNAPRARTDHTAVWTGTEMIVWGGQDGKKYLNTGGRYNPATGTWTPTPVYYRTGIPGARTDHTAVWATSTGQMIVWGGYVAGSSDRTNTGECYNPATKKWTPTSTENAPSARDQHTAVWTAAEMIVWGGRSSVDVHGQLNTGGRYNPKTNTWTPTPINNRTGIPRARTNHTAVLSGRRMIVWGGFANEKHLSTGESYNLMTNTWTPISTKNAPSARDEHTAVWTGTEMIVWGGSGWTDGVHAELNTGGRYNPANDAWAPTKITGAPSARSDYTVVWTGTEMIVWGGDVAGGSGRTNTGGRYDPLTNTWVSTSTTDAPSAREKHTAVWRGTEMIVWGGFDNGQTNTGGRYSP